MNDRITATSTAFLNGRSQMVMMVVLCFDQPPLLCFDQPPHLPSTPSTLSTHNVFGLPHLYHPFTRPSRWPGKL